MQKLLVQLNKSGGLHVYIYIYICICVHALLAVKCVLRSDTTTRTTTSAASATSGTRVGARFHQAADRGSR